MSEQEYGPWTIWRGGDCPVPGSERVMIRASTGDEIEDRARRFPWHMREADPSFPEPGLWTITAYRRLASRR